MVNAETGDSIVFNGEIYNYRELREQLLSRGHRFHSETDTEVLLKAYAEWGEQCVQRLRGMFAFGIWDMESRRLFLARDHLGIKPLYYYNADGDFIFASEVRGVLASDLVPRSLDIDGLIGFLSFGALQDPQTIIKGVRSVLPGHWLHAGRGKTTVCRYWHVPSPNDDSPSTRATVDRAVREMLADSTASQLVSDVPLGAFLSGGVDSTAVVALMQGASHTSVRTVSVVFEEPDYDERKFSRIAAASLGTNHTELLLRDQDVSASLSSALAAYDQPSIDGLNTYYVSRATRGAGLTVALSGLGADEVFGGYEGYAKPIRAEAWARRLNRAPAFLRGAASRVFATYGKNEVSRRATDFLRGGRAPYFFSRQLFSSAQIAVLLGKPEGSVGESDPCTFRRIENETLNFDPINRAAAFELQTYMLSMLLRDTDQMSMAHSLEVRVPFLDYRLVELLFRIPGRWKVSKTEPKPLLTRSLGSVLPAECVSRPKMGFTLPLEKWLRGSLEREIRESFISPSDSAPFQPQSLMALWSDFERGRVNWSRIWGIFSLRSWLERHKVNSAGLD